MLKKVGLLGGARDPDKTPEMIARKMMDTAMEIYKREWTPEKGEEPVVQPQVAVGDDTFLGHLTGVSDFFSSTRTKDALGSFIEAVLSKSPTPNPFVILVVEGFILRLPKTGKKFDPDEPLPRPSESPDRVSCVQVTLYTQQKATIWIQDVEDGRAVGDVEVLDNGLSGRLMPSWLDSELRKRAV